MSGTKTVCSAPSVACPCQELATARTVTSTANLTTTSKYYLVLSQNPESYQLVFTTGLYNTESFSFFLHPFN